MRTTHQNSLMQKGTMSFRGVHSRRRGSTLILVLWTMGITTLILLSLQVSAMRQAAAGREAIARVQAKWAARAGVEECIAYLAWEVENAEDSDPVQLNAALEEIAIGEVRGASWEIARSEEGERVIGPLDMHSKININLMTTDQLMLLEYMTEEFALSLEDWKDEDDEATEGGGTESEYYEGLNPPYSARNDSIRSIEELELIYGLEAVSLRGEDWNLNGILDSNEDDGDLTWPFDNSDGYLDAGWSELITAVSKGLGFGPSGEAKLMFATADLGEIQERIGVNADQAQALKFFAARGSSSLESLITTPLSEVGGEGGGASEADDLDDDQLRRVLDEGMTGGIARNVPGKVNINTAPREVLELIPDVSATLADQIVFARDSSSRGFTNIMDLMTVPGMELEQLEALAAFIDVRSNVYEITSRGRAQAGRTEVEIVVTIDRSELPIRIIGYLER